MTSSLSDFAERGYLIGEMQAKSDGQLLREYAEHGMEGAFTELVHRHTNLVYSAALRQVEAPDLAAEVAQCVFIGLARGARALAPRLARDASLAGWLCRSARNVSLNHRRDEIRRHSRERLAMEANPQNAETAPDWEQLRPVLDAAMTELEEGDHDALVMRFFRNQDLRSVGRALGVSDDTAQKRVSRALDKLRELLTRRGITTTAGALAAVLAAKAVQAAPAGLAVSISSAAAVAGSFVNTTTTLALTKNIAMTTLQKALVTGTLAAALGTGFYEARRASRLQEETQALRQQQDALTAQLQQAREDAAKAVAAAQLKAGKSVNDISELVRLRAEVAKLRDQARELARLKSSSAAEGNDAAGSELSSWLMRVKKLKDRVEQMPNERIPEFQFLTDQDWLDAVKKSKTLETDADYAQALSALRGAARSAFATVLQNAITGYSQANNGQLPGDFSQLKPYFASGVDDSVLQGYQFSQSGTIATKPAESLIDQDGNYFTSRMEVTMNSVSISTSQEDALHQAIQAFLAANAGQNLTDPSQLLPYVQTQPEKEALQKLIQGAPAR